VEIKAGNIVCDCGIKGMPTNHRHLKI